MFPSIGVLGRRAKMMTSANSTSGHTGQSAQVCGISFQQQLLHVKILFNWIATERSSSYDKSSAGRLTGTGILQASGLKSGMSKGKMETGRENTSQVKGRTIVFCLLASDSQMSCWVYIKQSVLRQGSQGGILWYGNWEPPLA